MVVIEMQRMRSKGIPQTLVFLYWSQSVIGRVENTCTTFFRVFLSMPEEIFLGDKHAIVDL